MRLTKKTYYLILLITLSNTYIFGQDTFLDNFTPANYTGNDGTQNWNGGWTENDFGGTNSGAGRIRINNNQLRFRNFDSGSNLYILRNVDLSAYSAAVLTFDYNRTNGNESVGAFFLNTSTGFYDFAIGTPTGGGASGSLTFNIPAAYINASSSILFFSNSGDWGNNETVFIDNVLITATGSTPEISINDVTVNENAGTIDFTVSHTGGTTTGNFTIEYNTVDNSANAPGDYLASTGTTINFTGTSLSSQTISIPIIDDNEAENAENFFVNLSNPSDGSVTITDNQGIGTINANDQISITINNVSVNESAGTANFTVTSSGGSLIGGYTLDFATADDSATVANNDYTDTSASLTFSGSLNETETITVPILEDTTFELDETYFVNLSNPSSSLVTISDDQGLGTIVDNDAGISINDISVNETAGSVTFTVTLTRDVPGGFSVEYNTTNNTAVSPNDYTATGSPNPIINFTGNNGETQSITIPIIDDTDIEGVETFFVNLLNTSSSFVEITDNQGIGTIIDDEAPFIITDTVTDNACSGIFVDSGSLNGQYNDNETITYTLCPDTPGSSIVLNFTSFDIESPFDFLQVYEGTNTTTLIDTYNNGNIPTTVISTDPSGCLTFIFDSDGSVTGNGWEATISCSSSSTLVTVNNVTVNENAGTATFTATHSGGNVPGGFTVNYATLDDTAYADSDFVNTTGTLNFSGTSGESQTITVSIINNVFGENTETFFLNLSNSTSPLVGLINGVGTILDDGDAAVADDVPLAIFDDFNGYYDYALTAGTLRTADEGVDPCSITASSSNILTTPILAGSTIERAYLTWGHSGQAADDVVTFQGQSVTADVVNTAFGFYYGMVSDVTSIINSLPDPSGATYTFTDLVIDNSTTYCGSVVFGGWSLYIFYTNPTLPAVSINMYNGFDAQGGGGGGTVTSSYTLDGFFAIGSSGSKTSVLSWEGDPTRTGNEVISVTTTSGTTNLTGDGNNSPTLANVFNSTIYDDTASPTINDSSLFGFDLDTYNISSLIAQGETSATTNIQTAGDFVILNSVLLKVPSNLMTGTVFEDINYPGGTGRDLATSSGVGIEGALVELYDNTGTFIDSDITDSNGDYNIGGMANGTYTLRVVNNTVRSTRGGGTTCTTCLPTQTFRSIFSASTLGTVTNEIGGTNPLNEDVTAGTLTGAQTISVITIENEGAVDIDFGFNFNTIVNTNSSGQGSLSQFIINSNNLDETGLNIEANGIFDPAAGQDTSIFMIPPTGDPLGRAADPNFITGFFDINLPNIDPLDDITDDSTHIDGRTQTAYSGDTNTGTIGSGGTIVGISGITLPNYNLPEIQVRSDFGDVIQLQASNLVIRNLAVYGGNRRAIRQDSGTGNLVTANLLGVNALGVTGTVGVGSYVDDGFEINGGQVTLDGNYISSNTDFGISVNGGTSTLIQNNHITNNGFRNCEYNIRIASGSGVVIQNNLIDNSAATGIFDNQGNVTITENTITTAGSNSGAGCTELSGINLAQSNSSITNNIINNNGGAGIVLTGGTTSGNLISQNSIFANGTVADALGIDIASDGVTINDVGDADTGPNGSLNFPLLESVTISGTNLKIIGWSRPGAIIEVFLTDINQGTATVGDNQLGLSLDYGEGQTYLGSGTEGSGADLDNTISLYTNADGNTDNTNRFNISIPLGTTIPVGSLVTSTATISNTTSEFGNRTIVGAATVITNRKITYRVKPN
ncbi:right-handed parallel beta-helix repeat-containing protein [Aquimarina sp. MMG015]|uniref:beta strand repeat-containing protein n=1 Tax=Aquimarina sp. MMG015 TaxID=2822689 RepID=UPI001B3A6D0D|nr:Calx-beta domain-containing protein [Aquimarina sp. MMG015]MBQ4804865.1 right-handed parallel beta-helix repeat-containing protein [Aquimarina sp. MMG015]